MKPVRRGKSRRFLHPRWWLPVSALASLLLHLIIGIGGQELGWFSGPPEPDQAQTDDGITVVLTHRPVDRQPVGEVPQPVAHTLPNDRFQSH